MLWENEQQCKFNILLSRRMVVMHGVHDDDDYIHFGGWKFAVDMKSIETQLMATLPQLNMRYTQSVQFEYGRRC